MWYIGTPGHQVIVINLHTLYYVIYNIYSIQKPLHGLTREPSTGITKETAY